MRISFLLLQEIAINGNSIIYSILAITGSCFSYYLLGMLMLANSYYWLAKSLNRFKFYSFQIVAFTYYLKAINKKDLIVIDQDNPHLVLIEYFLGLIHISSLSTK